MKKIISMALALTLIFSTMAYAEAKKPAPAPIKDITIKVDGKDLKWPIVISKAKPKISTPKPYMQGEAVMVPLKPVAAVVGYKVFVKGKTVTVASGTAKTMFTLGAAKAVVNGTEKALQSPAVLKSNAVYVPAELLSPMFGFTNQDWFADTKTLAVYSQFAVQDLWTRLYNSNRYERSNKKVDMFGSPIVVKGWPGLGSFGIMVDNTMGEPNELTIRIFRPTYEVRQKLKDVLKLAYPTGWEKAYDYYMKTERQEIFELNYTKENFAGTYNKYFDNRHLTTVHTMIGSPETTIRIGYENRKYKVSTDPMRPGTSGDPYLQQNIERFRLNEY